MKYASIPFIALSTAVCLFFLPSCQKDINYYQKHPQELAGLCQIKKMIVSSDLDPEGRRWDTLTFTYNTWGDPISALPAGGPSTGQPNFEFRYDKYHRLTDFLGAYDANGGEFWHLYSYADSRSQYPYVDTEYIFPTTITNPPPASFLERRAISYEYDAKGRITKITEQSSFPNALPVVRTFTYNPDGSEPYLQGAYDNKVNLNLTNKVWMFLNRSYSPHNAFTAVSYNAYGLPTLLDFSNTGQIYYYFNAQQETILAQFVYDCPCQSVYK
jgi:hypothetical protein